MGGKKNYTNEGSKKNSHPKLELRNQVKISSNEKVSPIPVTTIFERKLSAFFSPLYTCLKSLKNM